MQQIQPKPYGSPEASKLKFGLFGCLAAVLVLALIVWGGIRFLLPALSSKTKGLSGSFLHAAAVSGPGGEARLWILTDGSFQYILRQESPGRLSIARKCKFCKTWTYVYDPVRKAVLAKFKTDYKTIIIRSWMTSLKGKIWVATDAYEENEPRIFVYSSEPPGLLRETPAIIGRYPELGSGLIKIRMERDPDRLILDTKDGRVGLVLTLEDEKLYASEAEFRRALAARDEEQMTAFVLGREDSGPRKILYKVTGPRGKVKDSSLEAYIQNPSSRSMWGLTRTQVVAPGRVFLEGLILYQDNGGCLILHQDAAGRVANRLLTFIDERGNEKWTAGPAELFKEIRLDADKNALSDIFFMKDNIAVSRAGNVIVLQLTGVGLQGFDFATGRKLWEVRL